MVNAVLTKMTRVLVVLALCAVGVFADLADFKVLQERQKLILTLFNRIHEPLTDKVSLEILGKFSLDKNLDQFGNVTAAKTYAGLLENKWHLPRDVPYSPYEPPHNFESFTLFNVLYSAKTFETFYNTAVYLREITNQGLYFFVLSATIFYRPDTQGITIPPIYEQMPSYFNYGQVVGVADKVKAFGHSYATEARPVSIYSDDAVINADEVFWPYGADSIGQIKYFTNDYGLNSGYYFSSALYPYWLGKNTVPGLANDRRGEIWWFNHKQIVNRYYLERLSAGLGEIPEINGYLSEGFFPGLVYENGIPYPSRPDEFLLDRDEFAAEMEAIKKFEDRIWDAIDEGFYVDQEGKKISLMTEQGIDVLGNLIEANADSPNNHYYKDYIRLWKAVLGGNVYQNERVYYNRFAPLVVPSALENYQTALRDPAFYILMKRVLRFFEHWQKRMPLYRPEDLTSKGVTIEKVEVDKLVTYFDKHMTTYYPNIFKLEEDNVMIRTPRLNHKPYSYTVSVKSEEAKKVFVKFFLAPKYDSKGFEIPLHKNTENFMQLDQFIATLKVGENTIVRKSIVAPFSAEDYWTTGDLYQKVVKGEWKPTWQQFVTLFPSRLMLPKGHADGFPFLFITYVQDYEAPKKPFFKERGIFHGVGTGARFPDDYPLGYPANRPLYSFQVAELKNFKIQDIKIYHEEQ